MKKLIMTTAALAMFASGPAFAGCGAHGGYGRAYSAPVYAKPKYSVAPRAVAARPAPAAKPVKVAALQTSAQSDGGGSGDVEAKTQPAVAAAPVKTAEAPVKAAVETATPAAGQRECKKYSATIGGMITVPCE